MLKKIFRIFRFKWHLYNSHISGFVQMSISKKWLSTCPDPGYIRLWQTALKTKFYTAYLCTKSLQKPQDPKLILNFPVLQCHTLFLLLAMRVMTQTLSLSRPPISITGRASRNLGLNAQCLCWFFEYFLGSCLGFSAVLSANNDYFIISPS